MLVYSCHKISIRNNESGCAAKGSCLCTTVRSCDVAASNRIAAGAPSKFTVLYTYPIPVHFCSWSLPRLSLSHMSLLLVSPLQNRIVNFTTNFQLSLFFKSAILTKQDVAICQRQQ